MVESSSSLAVTLETVTPVFLGGADPRGAPELRPPAFRGAMRYWLRAALGGVIWG
jgi:CRISPR-associated protein Cmr1